MGGRGSHHSVIILDVVRQGDRVFGTWRVTIAQVGFFYLSERDKSLYVFIGRDRRHCALRVVLSDPAAGLAEP